MRENSSPCNVILADRYRALELKVFMRKIFVEAKNNLE